MNRALLHCLWVSCLWLGSPGLSRGQNPPPASAAPISVSAAQAGVRSLEKWLPVKADVVSIPAPFQVRLALNLKPSNPEPIQKGQAVRVPIPPPRSGYAPGVVDLVSPGPGAGTLHLELLALNPAQAFGVGQSIIAEIQVLKRPNALVVPVSAVVQEGNQAFVFKLDQGSGRTKAQKAPVRVGSSDGQWIEVRFGLWPGQWLATSNLNRLTNGALVLATPR